MTQQRSIHTSIPEAEETFTRHAAALRTEQLAELVATFHDDATVIANKNVYRGLDGVRQVFLQLLSEVPHAQWEAERVWADDVLYVEWKASSTGVQISDGVDTLIFRDGKIRVQTIHYSLQRT
jgi:ketosteroid isomerase-like protein